MNGPQPTSPADPDCPECGGSGLIRLGEDDGHYDDLACLRCDLVNWHES